MMSYESIFFYCKIWGTFPQDLLFPPIISGVNTIFFLERFIFHDLHLIYNFYFNFFPIFFLIFNFFLFRGEV